MPLKNSLENPLERHWYFSLEDVSLVSRLAPTYQNTGAGVIAVAWIASKAAPSVASGIPKTKKIA